MVSMVVEIVKVVSDAIAKSPAAADFVSIVCEVVTLTWMPMAGSFLADGYNIGRNEGEVL